MQSRFTVRFSSFSFSAQVVSLSSTRPNALHCPSAAIPAVIASQLMSPLQSPLPPPVLLPTGPSSLPPLSLSSGVNGHARATSEVQLDAATMVIVEATARQLMENFMLMEVCELLMCSAEADGREGVYRSKVS